MKGRSWLFALLCCIALTGCKVELFGQLDQKEANEMSAVLMRQNIFTERVMDKERLTTLFVDEDDFAAAVEILKANGLPREDFATMGEVFGNEGLISSPTEERARMIYALSQELSRTLTDIDGVLSARIHVVLPDNDRLRGDGTPSSASVFVRHRHDMPVDKLTPQIKMLVANSISGLVYDNVSVVLVPVEMLESAGPGTMPAMRNVIGLWIQEDSAARAQQVFYSLIAIAFLALLGNAIQYYHARTQSHLPTRRSLARMPDHDD